MQGLPGPRVLPVWEAHGPGLCAVAGGGSERANRALCGHPVRRRSTPDSGLARAVQRLVEASVPDLRQIYLSKGMIYSSEQMDVDLVIL